MAEGEKAEREFNRIENLVEEHGFGTETLNPTLARFQTPNWKGSPEVDPKDSDRPGEIITINWVEDDGGGYYELTSSIDELNNNQYLNVELILPDLEAYFRDQDSGGLWEVKDKFESKLEFIDGASLQEYGSVVNPKSVPDAAEDFTEDQLRELLDWYEGQLDKGSPSLGVVYESLKDYLNESEESEETQETSGDLNPNEDSKSEIEQVKGIGDVLSGRIVMSRPYFEPSDLTGVKYIGPKRLGNMKDYGLTIEEIQEPAGPKSPEVTGLEQKFEKSSNVQTLEIEIYGHTLKVVPNPDYFDSPTEISPYPLLLEYSYKNQVQPCIDVDIFDPARLMPEELMDAPEEFTEAKNTPDMDEIPAFYVSEDFASEVNSLKKAVERIARNHRIEIPAPPDIETEDDILEGREWFYRYFAAVGPESAEEFVDRGGDVSQGQFISSLDMATDVFYRVYNQLEIWQPLKVKELRFRDWDDFEKDILGQQADSNMRIITMVVGDKMTEALTEEAETARNFQQNGGYPYHACYRFDRDHEDRWRSALRHEIGHNVGYTIERGFHDSWRQVLDRLYFHWNNGQMEHRVADLGGPAHYSPKYKDYVQKDRLKVLAEFVFSKYGSTKLSIEGFAEAFTYFTNPNYGEKIGTLNSKRYRLPEFIENFLKEHLQGGD